MATLLQLAQQTFGGKLSLEVLDGSFHSFAVDDDLKWLTLDGFTRVAQGTGKLTNLRAICKPKSLLNREISVVGTAPPSKSATERASGRSSFGRDGAVSGIERESGAGRSGHEVARASPVSRSSSAQLTRTAASCRRWQSRLGWSSPCLVGHPHSSSTQPCVPSRMGGLRRTDRSPSSQAFRGGTVWLPQPFGIAPTTYRGIECSPSTIENARGSL